MTITAETAQQALDAYPFNPTPAERTVRAHGDAIYMGLTFNIPRDGQPRSHLGCVITAAEAAMNGGGILDTKLGEMQAALAANCGQH